MLAIGLAFAFSLDKAWSRRNRLKHQIPIGMRLVKAKKMLAPHSMQGARKLYATERGSSGQPRMNEERAKSQKLTPRMWKTRRGEAVSDDSKRWSWMAPAPP